MPRISIPAALVAVAVLAGCSEQRGAREIAAPERGKYLVLTAGCQDCHTPLKTGPNGPEPDTSRWLAGNPEQAGALTPPELPGPPWGWAGSLTNTAFAGPWGISYASNLTPDEETGIGAWDETTFIQAIRSGRHRGGGRPTLPPMPWSAYANFTDEDLAAIPAYLKTVPPVVSHVPDALVALHPPAAH